MVAAGMEDVNVSLWKCIRARDINASSTTIGIWLIGGPRSIDMRCSIRVSSAYSRICKSPPTTQYLHVSAMICQACCYQLVGIMLLPAKSSISPSWLEITCVSI